MSLTDSLRYALKGSAVSSRSYVHKVAPTNGSSFQPGGVLRMDIPSGMRNTYLDPSQTWLEFQITPTFVMASGSNNIAALDGSAHSLIKKIEVYSSAGSNLLESIDNYNVLYHSCLNVLSDVDDLCSAGSVAEGFQVPAAVVTPNTATALGTVNYLTDPIKYRSITGANLVSGTTYTFQLPLMALIGTLGDKYIPLHALAADLRVEITWAVGLQAFHTVSDGALSVTTTGAITAANVPGNFTNGTTAATPFPNISNSSPQAAVGTVAITTLSTLSTATYSITNPYLHCIMVQVSDDAQAAIDAMTGGIYTWHGLSWRNFQVTKAAVTAATDQISFLIPARYSSLKQLLVTHRDSAAQASGAARAVTNTYSANVQQYQFRVGSVLMPQAKVSANTAGSAGGWWSEVLMELLRSFHKLGATGQPCAINLLNWTKVQGAAELNNGTFCIGLELESFANKSDVIMSGVSTLGQNVFFEATYATGTVPSTLVDAFASYDVLYTLQDGVLTAQF